MSDDFETISATRLQDTVAQLEEEIQSLKKKNSENLFCAVLITLILSDIIFFTHMQTWAAPIVVLVLEILLLIVLGRRMDVEDVEMLTNKCLYSYSISRRK